MFPAQRLYEFFTELRKVFAEFFLGPQIAGFVYVFLRGSSSVIAACQTALCVGFGDYGRARSCRRLRLVEAVQIKVHHVAVCVHLRGIFFHARHVECAYIGRLEVRPDSLPQIGEHPPGIIRESSGPGLNMERSHLCTDSEYFGVESGVKLAELGPHLPFQFFVSLRRYQLVLGSVLGRLFCGIVFCIAFFLCTYRRDEVSCVVAGVCFGGCWHVI